MSDRLTEARLEGIRECLSAPNIELRGDPYEAILRTAAMADALLAEVERLRAGIERATSDLHTLAHTTSCTGSMCDGCEAKRIEHRLHQLLNPTEGES